MHIRRVLYCLHENTFVDSIDAQGCCLFAVICFCCEPFSYSVLLQVDNVKVFAEVKLEKETMSVTDRMAMFHLLASFSEPRALPRPACIYNVDSLFVMVTFVKEHFVRETSAKTPLDTVMALAKKYFAKLEFNDDFIVNKLKKVDVKVSITYDKNRSHEYSRGVFVNMCLYDSYAAAAQKTNHVEEDNSVYERVPAIVFRGGCSSDIRVAEESPAVRCTNFGSRTANVEVVAKKASKKSGKKSTELGKVEMVVDEDSSLVNVNDEFIFDIYLFAVRREYFVFERTTNSKYI